MYHRDHIQLLAHYGSSCQLIYPLTEDQESEPLTHSGMIALLKNVGFFSTCTVSVIFELLLSDTTLRFYGTTQSISCHQIRLPLYF